MARDPSSDIPLRGSHAPRVGAGESRAEAATRRVESASATAAANGDGPDLLGFPIEAVDELTAFVAAGSAGDRGPLAPGRISTLLGVEESTTILSLLKTRLLQRSCVVRSDRLFGWSWSDGLRSSFGHCGPRFARSGSSRWRTSHSDSKSPCGRCASRAYS